MIDLTEEQRRELENTTPMCVRDPQTDQIYVLVPADVYERMRAIIDGYARRAGWDDPKMDEYEKYRKTSGVRSQESGVRSQETVKSRSG